MKLKLLIAILGVFTFLAIRLIYVQVVTFHVTKEWNAGHKAYLAIVGKLDQFIDSKGQFPDSIQDLNIEHMTNEVEKFSFTSSSNKCLIVFHGSYTTFRYSLDYGDKIVQTNKMATGSTLMK